MHTKYAKDGLVVVSVSVDEVAEKDIEPKVLKFLQQNKAVFTNVLLDEETELYQQKLGIAGPPCTYLFDRDNHYVFKSESAVSPELLERKIVELLKP